MSGRSNGKSSDALANRLNGMLNLLVTASVDTLDNSILERQAERFRLDASKPLLLPEDPQPWDKNISSMVKMLSDCLQEAPERVEVSEPSHQHQLTAYSSSHTRRKKSSKEQKEEEKLPEAAPVAAPPSAPSPPPAAPKLPAPQQVIAPRQPSPQQTAPRQPSPEATAPQPSPQQTAPQQPSPQQPSPRQPPPQPTAPQQPSLRQPSPQQTAPQTPAPPQPSDEDRRSALEKQLSETSYPKIGPGYSDSISVVSDLTIPTVVTGVHVPEEEYYDQGPPMQIGIKTSSRSRSSRNHAIPRKPSRIKPNLVQPQQHHHHDQQHLNWPPPPTPMSQPQSFVASQQQQQQQQQPYPVRRSGGAAAQRRQSHMAVLAQLEQGGGPGSNTASAAPSAPISQNSAQPAQGRPTSLTAAGAPKSVSDFPSLRKAGISNVDSEKFLAKPNYGRPASRDDDGRKRKSLLRMSNNYAASVSATSSRMLLNSSKTKANKNRPYGLMRRRGTIDLHVPKETVKKTSPSPTGSLPPETRGYDSLNKKGDIDLDDVLSTMGEDIDFIYRELSALEEDGNAATPAGSSSSSPRTTQKLAQPLPDHNGDAHAINESNLGSTAKIKYTLGSVARSLKNGDDRRPQRPGRVQKTTSHDSSTGKSSTTSDPLLIDQDGFIISGENGFQEDPFANSKGFGDFSASEDKGGTFGQSPSTSLPAKPTSRPKKTKPSTRRSLQVSPTQPAVGTPPERRRASEYQARSGSGSGGIHSKETRIDAVEQETKKRIEMLRKLVADRSNVTQEQARGQGGQGLHSKLDFVEAETLKQIARLRTRLGESQRDLGMK